MICIYCFFYCFTNKKKACREFRDRLFVIYVIYFVSGVQCRYSQFFDSEFCHHQKFAKFCVIIILQQLFSSVFCCKATHFFRSPNSFQIFFAPKHDFSLKQCALPSFCHTQMALHRPECWSISAETELHFGRWTYAFRPKLRG